MGREQGSEYQTHLERSSNCRIKSSVLVLKVHPRALVRPTRPIDGVELRLRHARHLLCRYLPPHPAPGMRVQEARQPLDHHPGVSRRGFVVETLGDLNAVQQGTRHWVDNVDQRQLRGGCEAGQRMPCVT